MDFEGRFYEMFRDESHFPPPLQVTVKRRKSFSEKFFRSGSGSTLKLSGKSTLRLRQKFMFKSLSKEHLLENENKKIDVSDHTSDEFMSPERNDLPVIPTSPFSLSGSVECLPMSESVDSYLPVSTYSSVITLPKFKALKSTSQKKFGTFRRSDAKSSPYGSILKGRINRSRLDVQAIDFNEFDPMYSSSPLSYTFPTSPSINSSISSAKSVNCVKDLSESKANFYGQNSSKTPLARTDYSCRVTPAFPCPKENLNTLKFLHSESQSKQSKQIATPTLCISNGDLKNNSLFSFEDSSTADPVKILSSDNNSQGISDFQKELLSKFTQMKASTKNLSTKQPMEDSDEKSDTSELSDISQGYEIDKPNVSVKPNIPCKPIILPKPKQDTFSKDLSHKPDIFSKIFNLPKPDVLPKEENSFKIDILSKQDSCFKPDVSSKEISPKPDILTKPNVPMKPNGLKSFDKFNSSPKKVFHNNTPAEINNNCILLNNIGPTIPRLEKSPHFPIVIDLNRSKKLLHKSSLNQIKPTNGQIRNEKMNGIDESQTNNSINISKSLSTHTSLPTLSPKNGKLHHTMKVRDLVKSFNDVLLTPKENSTDGHSSISDSFSQTSPYPSTLGTQTICKKSSSEWNLTHAKPLNGFGSKYGSISEQLNHKSVSEAKVPHLVQVLRGKSFRTKV